MAKKVVKSKATKEKKPVEKKTTTKRVQKPRPMRKGEFLTAMAERTELTKKDVETVFNAFAEFTYETVKGGVPMIVPGLGRLLIVDRKARKARNPKTGAIVDVPAKKALKFRLMKAAKVAILPDTVAPKKKKAVTAKTKKKK